MARMRDVVIIGGGHNGLVAAAFLARAGPEDARPRAQRSGRRLRAAPREIAPGFRCPTLAHAAAIDPAHRAGARAGAPRAARSSGPTARRRARRRSTAARSTLWADAGAARARDSRVLGGGRRAVSAVSRPASPRSAGVLRARLRRRRRRRSTTRPPADLIELLKTGREVSRARQGRRVPAAALDADGGRRSRRRVVRERTAARDDRRRRRRSDRFSVRGPRAAPPSCCCSARAKGIRSRRGWFVGGGPGALADALAAAARQAGVEIRTGADVARIDVARTRPRRRHARERRADRRARRRVERRSEAHAARARRSDAPRAGVRPARAEHPRARHAREGELRGVVAAAIHRAVGARRDAAGEPRCPAASGSPPTSTRIERAFDAAKYGGFADEPWIELAIPSIADPALAPAGQHVVSAYVQYAPLSSARRPTLGCASATPRRRRHAHDRALRAGLRVLASSRAR